MSANNYLNPKAFTAAQRKPAPPPVTPPTSAPVSSGTPMNAGAVFTFSSAARAASAMAGPPGKE